MVFCWSGQGLSEQDTGLSWSSAGVVRVYQRRTLACRGLLLEWSGSIRAGRWPGELLCQTGLDSPPAPLRTAPWYLRSDHRTRSFFFPLEHKVVHTKYTKHKWGLLCPQDQILHCIKRKGYLHASSLVLYKCVSYYLSSPPPPSLPVTLSKCMPVHTFSSVLSESVHFCHMPILINPVWFPPQPLLFFILCI